jgi:hypothetical protein
MVLKRMMTATWDIPWIETTTESAEISGISLEGINFGTSNIPSDTWGGEEGLLAFSLIDVEPLGQVV